MKKKIPLLLALVMSAASFTACNLPGKEEHEHTFSDKYTQNKTHHWFAATCEHGEEKLQYTEHSDTNEDGVCDVCAYEVGHTHTFSDDWSKDDTSHWHAATCSHTEEKSDAALHTDANEDGKCDVCDGHVHLVNDAGYCVGCNTQVVPIDENDIAAVINATIAQNQTINGGEVEYNFTSVTKSLADENGKNAYANLSSTVGYTLGNNAAYVERLAESEVYNKSDFGGVWQLGEDESLTKTWFYMENGEVQGFEEMTYNGEMIPQFVAADEDCLSGYYFAVSTLADGWGAETILFNLYTLSQEASASDYVLTHDAENNTYTFAFNSLIINTDTAEGEGDSVRYYETSVSFGYSDNYALTSLSIQCDAYTNDAGTNTGEADVDYDYDQENKTITMRETADPDTYTFAVTQTVGARTYTHNKDISEYLPDSFTFDVENGAELAYTAMDTIEIGFDAVPSESFDMVKANNMIDAQLICNDGESSSFAFIYINMDGSKSIMVENIAAGNYTLQFVYLEETIWSVSINVQAPIVVGDYVAVEITDNNTFDGQLVSFEAPASGTYTFNIPAGYGAIDRDEWDYGGFNMVLYVDPYMDANGGTFSVDIAQGDVYEFYLCAPTKGTHNITYTFEAKDVVSGGDIEDGNYDYATVLVKGHNTLYFSPAEIDANSAMRALVITEGNPYKFSSSNLFISAIKDADENIIARNADYTYTLPAGTYSIYFANLAMFGVDANVACAIEVKSMGNVLPDPVGTLFVEEDNLVTVSDANIASPGFIIYAFMPLEDGDYVFTADFDCIIMDADGNVIDTNSAALTAFVPYLIKLDVSSLDAAGEYLVTISLETPNA